MYILVCPREGGEGEVRGRAGFSFPQEFIRAPDSASASSCHGLTSYKCPPPSRARSLSAMLLAAWALPGTPASFELQRWSRRPSFCFSHSGLHVARPQQVLSKQHWAGFDLEQS